MRLRMIGLLCTATFCASVSSQMVPNAPLYVAPWGHNTGACTWSEPCATPDYAFHIARPGDIVLVQPGTYDYGIATATFANSGTPGKAITITCAVPAACRIQNESTGNTAVVIIDGSFVAFDGFEVTNTSQVGNNIGIYVHNSFVQITSNIIHHIETDCGDTGGGGIQVAGGGSHDSGLTDIAISGNRIYDINYRNGQPSCPADTVQSDGILAETGSTGISVTDNVIFHVSGGWGIVVGNPNSVHRRVNTVISGNTIFSTALGGITLISGDGAQITGNIVVNTGTLSGRCGINVPPGSDITYSHNDLWNNAGGNYCLEWHTNDQHVHADDLSVDPALGTTFVEWKPDGSGDYRRRIHLP